MTEAAAGQKQGECDVILDSSLGDRRWGHCRTGEVGLGLQISFLNKTWVYPTNLKQTVVYNILLFFKFNFNFILGGIIRYLFIYF